MSSISVGDWMYMRVEVVEIDEWKGQQIIRVDLGDSGGVTVWPDDLLSSEDVLQQLRDENVIV